MEIAWAQAASADMAALDKGIARHVKHSVERFVETGAGNIKRLQGIDPPEFRLMTVKPSQSSASATAATPTGERLV